MTTDPNPSADLVAALASLTDPPKDGRVAAGPRRYRYLELPDLLAEVRGKFAAHGWAILQPTTVADGTVTVTNLWLHTSGAKMTHPPFTLPCGRSPQDVGSATTYARRYSLAALVGLAGSDDDDGQTAQNAPRRDRPDPGPTHPAQRAHSQPDASPMAHRDTGAPSTTTLASKKQTQLLWIRLKESGMTIEQIRPWVQAVCELDTPDWHTADLTSAQVSALIDRLKNTPPPA